MPTIQLGEREREIDDLSYSEIVALVKERNRPSGGIKTVHEVAVNALLCKDDSVLEIGSNTGFTSVNLSLLTGCAVHGIDTIEESVREATAYAYSQGAANVKFSVANAAALDFPDSTFDAVWCSNVTSFIADKQKAISEYLRVLKRDGLLIVVPIYYRAEPPSQILKDVSTAVGTEIKVWNKTFWETLFLNSAIANGCALEKVYDTDHMYLDRESVVDSYVEEVLRKDHLKKLNTVQYDAVRRKFSEYIRLFNANLQYAQYSVMIYQKRNFLDERELFTTRTV